jgi:aerobic-type carbon monoxide dehydrogenase small subunit (CoxS/CutS family)
MIILSTNNHLSLYIPHDESEIHTIKAHASHNNLAIVNQAFHAH